MDKSSRHIIARDGDAFWFNNPQFVRASLPVLASACSALHRRHLCVHGCVFIPVMDVCVCVTAESVVREGCQVPHLADAGGQEDSWLG